MVELKRDLYVIHDTDNTLGAVKISETDAKEYNAKGFGIFWTVNDFSGQRRIKENLVQVNSWFVEIDGISKAKQLELIEKSWIPSMIVESKNGYHVYFNAKGATGASWREIMLRLGAFYCGDPKARLITQLARVPGYMHQKDPKDPFEVVQRWTFPVRYTETQMRYMFPLPKEESKVSKVRKAVTLSSDDFWERIYAFDCEEGLKRLSGTSYVKGEVYDFRRTSTGKQNIVVNGKLSSCFVDTLKRIGSTDKGGPSLYQWLKWYGHSPKTIMDILREVTPEVFL